jgi:hypothetical protein
MYSRNICSIAICVATLLAGARVALNAQESGTEATEPSYVQSTHVLEDTSTDKEKKLRWREGKRLIDHDGHFRQDGDGAIFVSETGHELVALANLNLERVTRTLKASDESESIRWNINGIVTEFNGRNYLLIQRAVYKSASPPPVPEQILN